MYPSFRILTGLLLCSFILQPAVQLQADQHPDAEQIEHSSHSAQSAYSPILPAEVVTEGVVIRVLSESNQLVIHHRPIPEWKMGEMQMKFHLGKGLSVDAFEAGQVLSFSLRQENMYRFIITEIFH